MRPEPGVALRLTSIETQGKPNFMHCHRPLATVLGLALLSACQPKPTAPATPASTSPPVATVNGQPISRELFEFYVKGMTGKGSSELTAEQRGQVLDNLIRGELVSQQASREGLDRAGDTAQMLVLSRFNVLQQAVSERYLKDKKPTEAELRAEYENQLGTLPKVEYHARHILVATEPFARKVVERLEKGEKFEDVAKKESMDASKDSGGDLGWFTPDRMVKPFSDAIMTLKPGQYTHAPVQTQFGWHVIQLLETRPLAPPPFDQVRQRLEQMIQARKFKTYTDELARNAKIEKKLDAPAGKS